MSFNRADKEGMSGNRVWKKKSYWTDEQTGNTKGNDSHTEEDESKWNREGANYGYIGRVSGGNRKGGGGRRKPASNRGGSGQRSNNPNQKQTDGNRKPSGDHPNKRTSKRSDQQGNAPRKQRSDHNTRKEGGGRNDGNTRNDGRRSNQRSDSPQRNERPRSDRQRNDKQRSDNGPRRDDNRQARHGSQRDNNRGQSPRGRHDNQKRDQHKSTRRHDDRQKGPSSDFKGRKPSKHHSSIPEKKASTRETKVRSSTSSHIKTISLARALAFSQFSSRAIGVELIQNSRVTVNGQSMTEPNHKIQWGKDKLQVDLMPLKSDRMATVVIHKEVGVVGSKEAKVRSIQGMVPGTDSWYYPLGRLDKAVSGLTILTNKPGSAIQENSDFADVEVEYHVKVNKIVGRGDTTKVNKGLKSIDERNGKETKSKILRKNKRNSWLQVTIKYGTPTDIRKVLKEAGLEVLRFHRYRIGDYTTDMLAPGCWMQANGFTLAQLRAEDPSQAAFFYREELLPEKEEDTDAESKKEKEPAEEAEAEA